MSKFKEHVLALLREKVAVEHYADGPAPTLVGLEEAAEAVYNTVHDTLLNSVNDSLTTEGLTGVKLPSWLFQDAVRINLDGPNWEVEQSVQNAQTKPADTLLVQFVEPIAVTPEEEAAIMSSDLLIDDVVAPNELPVAEQQKQNQVAIAEMSPSPALAEPKWWEENDKKRKGMHAVVTNMDGSTPMDAIDISGDDGVAPEASAEVGGVEAGGMSEAAVLEQIASSAYLSFVYRHELGQAQEDRYKALQVMCEKYLSAR